VLDFDDSFFDVVVDYRGGENFLFVFGEGASAPATNRGSGERGLTRLFSQDELGFLPAFDNTGQVWIGFSAAHLVIIWNAVAARSVSLAMLKLTQCLFRDSFALRNHASYNDPFDFWQHFGQRIHEIHPHQGSAGA
jgi:hypothetical protein